MAVAAAAALLDELMGRSRNDGGAIKKKTVKWEDPEVRITINETVHLLVNPLKIFRTYQLYHFTILIICFLSYFIAICNRT